MIFPAIVEESHPAIHGLPDEAYRSAFICCIAQMMSAESHRRDLFLVAAELLQEMLVTQTTPLSRASALLWVPNLSVPYFLYLL